MQKGFYPYEYMSDSEKFKEEIPRKEKFYSSLTSKKISDNEYDHAVKVWDAFEMKKMKNYHDFFEKIRNNSLALFRMGLFGAAHRWVEGKSPLLFEICYT